MQDDGTLETRSEDKGAEPVVISAPPAAPVIVDPQNPLPEPSFVWRRWIAIIICTNMLVFSWFVSAWLVGGQQWDHLYYLNRWMIGFAAMVLTYYFIAPSASELTNMIQSAGIIKKSLDMAESAAKSAADVAGSYAQRRFQADKSPDSQIPGPKPGGAPRRPSGDSSVSGDEDAAPRGRP